MDLIKHSKSEMVENSDENGARLAKESGLDTTAFALLSEKINEAIMLDDVQALVQLNLTVEQIIGFDYHVSIPR